MRAFMQTCEFAYFPSANSNSDNKLFSVEGLRTRLLLDTYFFQADDHMT